MNYSWPLAQLRITEEQLVLRVKFSGKYEFSPDQVNKVESFGNIPYLAKGVRIYHTVSGYPKELVFWYLCSNSQQMVDSIHESGFGT